MVELECKNCLFFDLCPCGVYEVPCEHFSPYGAVEEHLFDLGIDDKHVEYRIEWHDYISEFDDDFSF